MAVVVVIVIVIVIVVMVMAVVGHCVGQSKHNSGIHCTVLHGQGWCSITEAILQPRRHLAKLVIADTICTADQHKIGSLQLILEQLINGGEVIKAGILEALPFQCLGISDGAARCQRFTVDHGDHTIDMNL